MTKSQSLQSEGERTSERASETEGKCQVLNSNNHRMGTFPIQLQNSAVNLFVNIIMLDCVIDPK